MSWTDDRVERLSTLWLDGRSASQIAAELGGGVTRNAVIGKVHRLGLSGRAVPPAAEPPARLPDAAEAEVHAEVHAEVPMAEAATVAAVEAEAPPPLAPADIPAIPPSASPEILAAIPDVPPPAPVPVPIHFDLPSLRAKDTALPFSDRVTILELGASMCRWPIGDPTSAEFRFCGCRATGTLPYCQEHARVAFQPVADRRRPERLIRIA